MSKSLIKYIACSALLVGLAVLLINELPSSDTNTDVPHVFIENKDGKFVLMRHGEPYKLKGAGGDSHFAELAAAGGNSVRTWGVDDLDRILDEAHKHGLTVCAGIWLGHQRHGFDYQDKTAAAKQLKESLDAIRKYKDHPALLLWGVGNEMEGEGTDEKVWEAVNEIAREIKRVDPNHPTMTVIAELGENESKIHSIERLCPDIDIIGVNSYGGIESVGPRFRQAKSSKPYIITEHGPLGPWEVGKTSWGAPLEWTSTQKGSFYSEGHRENVVKQSGLCLGSYAFLWGHKQETTATWFGMLLPDGSRLAAVDAMAEAWTGTPPKNRCPQISALTASRTNSLKPDDVIQAEVTVSDPEKDDLTIKWVLRSDSGTIGVGGDRQQAESTFAEAVKSDANQATVTIPEGRGAYRLFAYVYDDQGGAAVANIPLFVPTPIDPATAPKPAELPYLVYGDDVKGNVYVPSGYMGNATAVSMELDCTDQPFRGKTCLKAQYKAPSAWGGVLWQSPANDWDGKEPGGANLTGATHLEFHVRGARGDEIVNFVFGVLDGGQPYRDSAKGELKDVKLTKDWKRVVIPLEGLDLRQIKTGFGWSLPGQGQTVTFYLDDIRYVKAE